MEKKHWKSDEPWKKHEPGAKLSKKERHLQVKSENERFEMEQNVQVILTKTLIEGSDLYHNFKIKMKLPLSKAEIMKRVHMAFPELKLKNGGGS